MTETPKSTEIDIKKLFPAPTFRPFQEEMLGDVDEAFRNYKYVILDASTGSGKSNIAATFARQYEHLRKGTHILTIMKILQDQYAADFPDFGCQKGKAAYTCIQDGETCAEGLCNRAPKEKKQTLMAHCPYKKTIRANQSKPTVIHNFDGFYFLKVLAHQFTDRPLLIIDEAHNIEDKFIDFFSFALRSDAFHRDKPEKFPVYKKIDEYVTLLTREIDRLSKVLYELTKGMDDDGEGISADDYKKSVDIERLLLKLRKFVDKGNKNEYVFDVEDRIGYNKITFRPVFAKEFIRSALFEGAEKVLMMSATILDKDMFCKNIGLELDEVSYLKMPSTFPLKRRPVLFDPVGSMSFREIGKTLPKLVARIEEIMEQYAGRRGIIQTISEKIANFIRASVGSAYLSRMTFRKDFETVPEMLNAHRAKPDSFIVASGLREGVDLKDELSRVQIICKIPYLDLSDKRVKRRMTLDDEWYGYMSSLQFVQMIGRSVRSPKDKAITYILDSGFTFFYHRNKRFIPAYIRDAIYL